MDPGIAAMIRHGQQVFLEDLLIHDHARRRQVFFVEVLEIAAGNLRLEFFVAGGGEQRPRGKSGVTTSSGYLEEASSRMHRKMLPHLRPDWLARTVREQSCLPGPHECGPSQSLEQ